MTRPSSHTQPLVGYRVGVTAARRQDELVALLERRGAEVVCAPAVRVAPLDDDSELLAATADLVANPADIVIATTGIGFRGWCEAADGWGLGDGLRAAMGGATMLARGPKAVGAIRAAGLREAWSPASESFEEVLSHLLDSGVRGKRIALQEHGEPLSTAADILRSAGADVVVLTVYRWEQVPDQESVSRLVEMVVAREVQALTFTSAPAGAALLEATERLGVRSQVIEAMQTDVLVACVGPVTAAPLEKWGISTIQPERARLGAMVRELAVQLPLRRHDPAMLVAGKTVEVRGCAVLVDGEAVQLSSAPRAVLAALAERQGEVMSRRELLTHLPSGPASTEHAVEMAVARLRGALGPKSVQTVVKRGYRLATEPKGAA
ncbi:MAG: uroporphyrinogen-III synthase [Propionibacteriales bacterium]|nr:uroporphyrinogen-III synthase [Propionibacteriales bacterium]